MPWLWTYIILCIAITALLLTFAAKPGLFWSNERLGLIAVVALGLVAIGVGLWQGGRHKRPDDEER